LRNAEGGPALREWAGFVAWLMIGAAYAVSFLAILTVGPFIVPVSLVMTVLLWRKRRADRELLGLVSGLALPLLYVGYLNRDGRARSAPPAGTAASRASTSGVRGRGSPWASCCCWPAPVRSWPRVALRVLMALHPRANA